MSLVALFVLLLNAFSIGAQQTASAQTNNAPQTQTPQQQQQSTPNATPTPVSTTPASAKTTAAAPITFPQRIVREGIAVEFNVAPVASATAKDKPTEVTEAEDASVSFKVTDTATGTPVTGLNISAWMTLREGERPADADKICREKVQTFMQGSLRARPDVDLNTYYVLALNKEANISVIDPLLGFGGSKLLTLTLLRSPGDDWVLTSDRKRIFVSMPFVNQVAVVDTTTWKVVNNIDTGVKPTRLALQPDEKYLWVGTDGLNDTETSGVSVIDTTELKKVADIQTGAGHHEIAFSLDNRYAFVTNRNASTLSVVDVQKLAKLTDIKTGASPVSMAVSPLSKAVYVVSERDGAMVVVDSQSHKILTRIDARPGLRAVRFAPGGRYGFVLNPSENSVQIFDAANNRLLNETKVGKAPDQVSFTSAFAYIRSAGSEEVSMIRLSTIGKELDITRFPGGQLAPQNAEVTSLADVIVPAPEGNSVLVANPADKQIYYYTEGMAAPMGNFQNYRREPKSVMIVDRSLREATRGVYSTTVKLPRSGNYDVAFLSDSPRIVHCFEASARQNPVLKRERQVALRIEHLIKEKTIRAGEDVRLRFKLYDTETNQPKDGLKDVRVLIFLSPGIWQKRDYAKAVGEGVYEVTFNVPQSGIYMVFVESQSQGVQFRNLPHLTLQATDAAKPASQTSQQSSGNDKQ